MAAQERELNTGTKNIDHSPVRLVAENKRTTVFIEFGFPHGKSVLGEGAALGLTFLQVGYLTERTAASRKEICAILFPDHPNPKKKFESAIRRFREGAADSKITVKTVKPASGRALLFYLSIPEKYHNFYCIAQLDDGSLRAEGITLAKKSPKRASKLDFSRLTVRKGNQWEKLGYTDYIHQGPPDLQVVLSKPDSVLQEEGRLPDPFTFYLQSAVSMLGRIRGQISIEKLASIVSALIEINQASAEILFRSLAQENILAKPKTRGRSLAAIAICFTYLSDLANLNGLVGVRLNDIAAKTQVALLERGFIDAARAIKSTK